MLQRNKPGSSQRLSLAQINANTFLSRQFATFVAVGVGGAALHWIYRYFINQFTTYVIALVCAYGLSLVTGFVLTKYLVFPQSRKSTRHQAAYFFLFHLSMFPIVFGISYGLSEFLFADMFSPAAARSLAHVIAVLAPAMANFVLQKFIAFGA